MTLELLSERVRYAVARHRRGARYGTLFAPAQVRDVAASIERDGYEVLRDVFSRAHVDQVRCELDQAVAAGSVKLASRKPVTAEQTERLRALAISGEENLAREQAMVYVKDPLVNCPAAVPIVFSDVILDIAAAYYGCPALILGPRMVKSFANALPLSASTVHHFHLDYRPFKFLKFFIYLNDVDEEGGPFCFVAGSHREKPAQWRRHPFEWSEEEIVQHYGRDSIRVLTGRRGDLLIADTRGFHRALKARARHRTQLRMGTGLLPASRPVELLPLTQYESLSPKQRSAAEDFQLV